MRKILALVSAVVLMSMLCTSFAFAADSGILRAQTLVSSQDVYDYDFCYQNPYGDSHFWSDNSSNHRHDCTKDYYYDKTCIYCGLSMSEYLPGNDSHTFGWRTDENADWFIWDANGYGTRVESLEELKTAIRQEHSSHGYGCRTYKCIYGCTNTSDCNVYKGSPQNFTIHSGYGNYKTDSTKYLDGRIVRSCECGKDSKVLKIIPKKKLTKLDKAAAKTVPAFVKKAKKYSVKGMNKLFKKDKTSKFATSKDFLYKYFKKYDKKIKYQMIDIKSFEKTAKVRFKVTYPSIKKNYSECTKAYNSYVDDKIDTFGEISKKAKDKAWKRFVIKGLPANIKKNGLATKNVTINLTLKKISGKWRIASYPSKLFQSVNMDMTI